MSRTTDIPASRRKYNQWVANETMEDYALRFTAKQSRRWRPVWVANTALGIVSFLALEAIGGVITLDYGFTNALWAILVVGAIIFLTGIPITYYAARDGVDIDLLTRGAGFGYIGSTVSSLIYASFTFIFFALEAAIMSMAIHMMVPMIPLSVAYVISALVVIPLVTHGITRISRFQAWTQPVWLVLQTLPLVYIALHESAAISEWMSYSVQDTANDTGFNLLLFGAAAAVIFPLIAQNGEQADFLRFLPPVSRDNKVQWWLAVLGAGPGWVVFGIIKLLIGSFLAVLALNHGLLPDLASDPAHMYAVAFGYVSANPEVALWLAGIFVVISQLKINVTNAYAGSIAWGNFFSRLTHSHPGRVVWLLFNVAIALMLMELGLYQAFETILITYASLVVAWVGSVVADLVINKPLGLSPKHIEFRRGHLYDINPVGVVSMTIASGVGITASIGVFGPEAKALAAFLALSIPFLTVPAIAWLSKGRYYLCRDDEPVSGQSARQQCRVCDNHFDPDDISHCPAYGGPICSLCCALDARCGDQCRPHAHLAAQASALGRRLLPAYVYRQLHSVTGHFLGIFTITGGIIAALLTLVYFAQQDKTPHELASISATLWQVFFLLLLITGVLIWLYVLAQQSVRLALQESQLRAELLSKEARAHEATAIELSHARDTANAANQAKTRYLSGVSHELRTPLNTIFGYTQLMEANAQLDPKCRKIASVVRRSSEHLSDVIEGLLEISKIEARKLELQRDTVDMRALIQQLDDMFRPLASAKGLQFIVNVQSDMASFVSADEKRLRQILLNLVSNALKFTPKGKIELDISYRNQVARMIVKDTGIGIEANDLEKIFEPFERLRHNQTHSVSGTGLGLSISRLLAELMGGSLDVNSQAGIGSEFCLSLFLPSVTVEPAMSADPTEVPRQFTQKRRILVVDDEARHRNLIHEYLHPIGFTVDMAASADQALAMLNQHSIDLFILDISMPNIDGWQLLEIIRSQGHDAPVIIVSASPYEDVKMHPNQRADFQAYINKPVRLNRLLDTVQRCLDARSCESKTNTGKAEAIDETDSAPGQASFDTLTQYARVGYLQGVLECIQGIESQYPHSHLVNRLRQLADNCDLDGILRIINEQEAQTEPC